MKLTRVSCRRSVGQSKERAKERQIGGKRVREARERGGVKRVRGWRGRENEHSLFGNARCGCRLSQPYHPGTRARGERLGEQRDRWVEWRGELYPAPEQCLIGNRATNNYPYARIRTTHTLVAIGLSWRGAKRIVSGPVIRRWR